MKLAFLGTPHFGALVLGALLNSGHEVAVVITQPDRPAGRGRGVKASEVKELALSRGVRVEQPERASTLEMVELLKDLGVEAMTVAAFGQILKAPLLGSMPCLNVHASLLPQYRGAAPIERAVMAGDKVTGVTIMEVEPKLDSGPIYASKVVPIEADDDAGSLYEKLGRVGGVALAEVLDALQKGEIVPQRQDDRQATYVEKITSADMVIDWSRPAWKIAAQVRGLSPHIGAFTAIDGQRLKVWRAGVVGGSNTPGTVVVEGERLMVVCGTGMLELLQVQPQGKRRLSGAEFLRGYRKQVEGKRLT